MTDRYRHATRPPARYGRRVARCLIAMMIAALAVLAVLAVCALVAGMIWLRLLAIGS